MIYSADVSCKYVYDPLWESVDAENGYYDMHQQPRQIIGGHGGSGGGGGGWWGL